MANRYAQARRDFERLEEIAILDDQVELDAERQNLMRNPTKEKAADMYQSAISLWFAEHRRRDYADTKAVRVIRARWGL